MRDPQNIQQVEYNGNKISIVKMDDIPPFDIPDYDLLDSKELSKYFDDIERKIIRNSFEYRQMVNFLRENLDMNKCSFYQNVNNIDTFKIKIHLHHEPFTLYDLVTIVYNKRLFFHECLEAELVAKEVMYLHYKLMVGLIPLAETVHELVHNSYLFVPMDKVFGNVQEFINMYEDFMSPEQLDLLERNRQYTKTYCEELSNNHILNKNYIYLDLTGAYDIPTLEEVVDSMNAKIKEIKGDTSSIYVEEKPKKQLQQMVSFGQAPDSVLPDK